MNRRARILEDMNRPEVVNTSGALALLLQFAHPLAAAGVASTGKFQGCPKSRIQHTSRAIQKLMTGSLNESSKEKLARHLASRHDKIKGELSETVGIWKAGTPFSASDPDLIMWVYATLVVSRVRVFSALHRPLSKDEQELFYESTRAFGKLFGVKDELRPATYPGLTQYFNEMLHKLTVGREARQLTDAFLASFGQRGSRVLQIILARLLPARLCEEYGFKRGLMQSWGASICMFLLAKYYARALPLVKRRWYAVDLHMHTQTA